MGISFLTTFDTWSKQYICLLFEESYHEGFSAAATQLYFLQKQEKIFILLILIYIYSIRCILLVICIPVYENSITIHLAILYFLFLAFLIKIMVCTQRSKQCSDLTGSWHILYTFVNSLFLSSSLCLFVSWLYCPPLPVLSFLTFSFVASFFCLFLLLFDHKACTFTCFATLK